jgi:N-acyl-D-amino-acid deacylase
MPPAKLQHRKKQKACADLLEELLAMGLFLLLGSSAVGQIPMTGTRVPSLEPIDRLVIDFMAKYGVPGAAVGFVKDGRLVYVRGFGYADTNTLELVQPDSLFRLASLSKPLTAVATLKLAEQGRFKLDQAAFPLLNYPAPNYPGAQQDARLNSITIRHLLNHTAGWNRDTALSPDGSQGFDPTVNWTVRAAQDMGTSAPANAATIVRWMLGKPLQFDPGTQYRYSNFGYTVLGRLIEKVTGTNYEQVVQDLLRQAGIARMRIGGSRFVEKLPGEVTYYDYPGSPSTVSIFPQDTGNVPCPYNFSYRAMDSHGGWVGSTIDLLRFVTAVDGRSSHSNLLSPSSISSMVARPTPPWGSTQEPYYGMGWQVRNTEDNWWHDGSLPGTRTEMVRAGNGFSWVLLFNTRVAEDGAFSRDMDSLGWQAQRVVSKWPTNNLFDAVLSYDSWKPRHFTKAELANTGVSGDDADPDGDGIPNLVEYASGLNPKKADVGLRPVTPTLHETAGEIYVTVSVRRLLLANEVSYNLEISDDLDRWQCTAQPFGDAQLNDDGTQSVAYRIKAPTASGGHLFIRLRVERLLH